MLRCFCDDMVIAGVAKRCAIDANGERIPLDEQGRDTRISKRRIIDTRDSAGRYLDLHALRHTLGTMLVASGADIKNRAVPHA
ncbi:MAG TPA: hypothetical protein VGP72_01885, partial [Planctomycetota bacterium]